ncbi:MAG: AAA family ATPase [Planctomycetaceae bacterium]|nr:AAA family ATPase [Planctomycetaceae bacterium]
MADVDMLEKVLQTVPDCVLIVIDPVGSYVGGRTDTHRDNEVRAVLTPVTKLADKYGPAVVVVVHYRKGSGGFADDTILGSRAFTGLARAVWHLIRDGENKSRRLLLRGKNNLAPEDMGLAFSIIPDPARIGWERDLVEMSADDALAAETAGEKQTSAIDEAVAWLKKPCRWPPTGKETTR